MFDDHPIAAFVTRHRGLLFPAAAASLVFVILIPLPTFVLDFLLLTNVVLSTVVLMTVIYLRSPLEFSSFPSLLLALTLYRLVLNTATTRLILSNGGGGTSAAGRVVETFGLFVSSGSLMVGVIIFLIITVIQFVVITKGATRIAEVAARFTLDGMPGKQMAIDADLNAGIINESEAKRRREEITAEADFYGAMDGASKFVRGDAVAGIVITFVNILGGLYVGMVEHNLGLMQSLDVYTRLTIGDGLSSQVPAFVLSVAAGMLVTRSTGKTNMGEELLGQLFSRPVALLLSGSFMCVLGFTPLPKVPLLTLAAGCGGMAMFLNRTRSTAAARRLSDEQARERAKPEKIESLLKLDALELQVGLGLVRLVDKARGGDLLDRIASMRKQLAVDLGLVVPPIRIRDSSVVEPNVYVVLIRGQEVARGECYPDHWLAIDSGVASEGLAGFETQEPAFGLRAVWIAEPERGRAERANYTVVEPTGAITTHLTEIIKRNAPELLTRGDAQKLVDSLKEREPALVDEVIPSLLKLGDVQRVLQNLLRERVPIRDLGTILETLGDWAGRTKDLDILTEYVRNALARTLCAQYRDAAGVLHCVTFDPALEDQVAAGIQRGEQGTAIALPPARQAALIAATRREVERAAGAAGATIVVLCAPQVRAAVRRILETALPQTPVLGLNEVVRGVEIRAHGVVTLEE